MSACRNSGIEGLFPSIVEGRGNNNQRRRRISEGDSYLHAGTVGNREVIPVLRSVC